MEDKGTSKTKYLNFNLLYVIRPITGYLNTHNPLSENFKNITPWLNLTFVIVPGNKITIVPSAFGKLRLECLNLSQNSLGKPNLSKWPWMEQSTIRNTLLFLDLSSNFLTRLPLNIGRLNNLKGIFISSNLLKELPQSIRNMHTLKYLYLRDNKFFYMPGIITLLDKLEVLSIAQNPLQIHTWKNKYKVLSLVELSANVTLQHRLVASNQLLIYK
ncbi:Leucine-rich repeat-containing protein 40 [Cyphomyrmex costatus]|uniref:Leucine-rich repeat-containing protein 40 n=1 Tax=Cyphomyrmex costatus TaxID=456900 RepID=A0A151I894_9HYME|nr:Leucine-rich repeat-containing protein 40 [Cyphomyrmex costatus]